MRKSDQILSTLRAAVEQSPENGPLRRHLAETLLGYGFTTEAVDQYRSALALAPRDTEVAVGLALALFQQEKHQEALEIIERLMKEVDPPPPAYVLHSRLLAAKGDIQRAAEQYQLAVLSDPMVADPALAQQLRAAEPVPLGAEDDRDARFADLDVPGAPGSDFQRPSIAFEDVGGMEPVKEEIRLKIIHPMQHRHIFEAYGRSEGGGILMYGPPGCGKSHLARATAGEVDVPFMAVGINEILDMWLGNSEKNLHAVFAEARRSSPCVLFFDEVDALGASRGDMRHSTGRHIINQFLEEMDGVKASNEGVLILAATNAPWYVDSAFRRPGRFDRVIFVPPPDQGARAAILGVLLRGKPVKNVDCNHVASRADGFSGADLKAVVDLAVEAKVKRAMQTGNPEPITTEDLLTAAAKRKPTTSEWLSAARNYVEHANQGGLYDDVARYLDGNR